MTKQEEIREGIAVYLYKCFSTWKESSYYDLSELNRQGWLQYADDILSFLHSQGCVLKVDRELPDKNKNNTWYDDDLGEAGKIGYDLGVEDALKAIIASLGGE